MKVGELKGYLADLPDDMDITVDIGVGDAWTLMKERWDHRIEEYKKMMVDRGADPSPLDKVQGPYTTLHQSGLPRDILFLSLSMPDFENNRIALEL